MSWDATLTFVDADHGDYEFQVYTANYTHNTNPMIRAAGFADWWKGADGMIADEMESALRQVLDAFNTDPRRFRAMNPDNGWGDFDSLSDVLIEMHQASRACPTGQWTVSG